MDSLLRGRVTGPQYDTGTIVAEGKEHTAAYRLLAMKSALWLECKGLKNSRGSVYAQVKREFGLKGSKQRVLEQFEQILREMGILR